MKGIVCFSIAAFAAFLLGQPTILLLTGLKNDYAYDGRVLFEALDDEAVPGSLRDHRDILSDLAEAYKQINAPRGALGVRTLTGVSTTALKGDDATYASLEARIDTINQAAQSDSRRNDRDARGGRL